MLRGFVQNWKAFDHWTPQYLKKHFGKQAVRVYRKTKGTRPTTVKMKMREYLEYLQSKKRKKEDLREPMWLVETELPNDLVVGDTEGGLLPVFERAFQGLPFRMNNYQFMIAPKYAGASPHFHHSAANVLVYGRKRWFLFPPASSLYSTKHINSWVHEDYNRTVNGDGGAPPPLECVQQPGDIIYVPDMWAHGVVYPMESVGIAYLYNG
jgi:hypothetical protein